MKGLAVIFASWGPYAIDPALTDQQDSFYDEVEDHWYSLHGDEGEEITTAIGCYLFATKRGEKYKPWYVGKAEGKDGFRQEIFTKHKLDHYGTAMDCAPQGKPVLFLFPLITKGEKFSRAKKPKTIAEMERILIGLAYAKNPDLLNIRDTKLLREGLVDGVFGKQKPGRPYKSASEARKALL